MFNTGRVCVKTAGKEAGNMCVILKKLENGFYLIDGDVRRKKCNASHLEPTRFEIDIKKNSRTKTIVKKLENLGFEVKSKQKAKNK